MNDGYLGTGRKDTDYIAGTLPYQVVLESGDWRPYLPTGERQSNYKGDSMSCVSFSALNVIETQEFKLTGQRVNYSDRWLAKISNTQPEGNYLITVVDAIREFGLVLEEDYPAPPAPWTWYDYHKTIPEPLLSQLKAKGQAWKKKWGVGYEWIDIQTELHTHLKHAPMQTVLPGHAVAAAKQDVIYLDTYEPFIKEKPKSAFASTLKIVLTPKNMNQTRLVLSKDGHTVYRCEPVATTFEDLKKQMGVIGVNVPNPIPPSSDL